MCTSAYQAGVASMESSSHPCSAAEAFEHSSNHEKMYYTAAGEIRGQKHTPAVDLHVWLPTAVAASSGRRLQRAPGSQHFIHLSMHQSWISKPSLPHTIRQQGLLAAKPTAQHRLCWRALVFLAPNDATVGLTGCLFCQTRQLEHQQQTYSHHQQQQTAYVWVLQHRAGQDGPEQLGGAEVATGPTAHSTMGATTASTIMDTASSTVTSTTMGG